MVNEQEIQRNIRRAFLRACELAHEEHALGARITVRVSVADKAAALFVMSKWYAPGPHIPVNTSEIDAVPDEFYLFMVGIIAFAEGPFIYNALRTPLMGYRSLIEVFYEELVQLGYLGLSE